MPDIRPVFVVHPLSNSEGKKDASGAFIPKAHDFLRIHSVGGFCAHPFNNKLPLGDRLAQLQLELAKYSGLRTFVAFCHGWKDGLQFGVTDKNVDRFVGALERAASPEGVKVVLYSCDAGRDDDGDRKDDTAPGAGGEGGIADLIRDAFRARKLKATVIAHASRGHTTDNPHVRVFTTQDPEVGGSWLIAPRSAPWGAWCRALKETTLWARFPWMSREETLQELREAQAKRKAAGAR